MSEFNSCLRSGKVAFGNDFDTLVEVTHLWGLDATRLPYHNWFNVPGEEDAIAILISENGGDGWHNVPQYGLVADSRGWAEILAVSEFNNDAVKTAERIDSELKAPRTRYVFWRMERNDVRWYKFTGEFKVDVDATRESMTLNRPAVIYRRTSTSVDCLKIEEVRTEFSDAEFAALANKQVEFAFRDDIGVVNVDGAVDPMAATILPGARFVVEKTTDCLAYLVDAANGAAGSHYAVPRRDFALGYLHVLPDGRDMG